MDVKVSLTDDPKSASNFPLGPLPKDDAFAEFPKMMKWLIKIGIVILAALAVLLGFITIFSFDYKCVFGGIILVLTGIGIIIIEAPFLCAFCKFVDPLKKIVEKIKPWMKVPLYIIPTVPILILCPGAVTIFGCIFVLLIASAYIMSIVYRKRDSSRKQGFDNIDNNEAAQDRNSTPVY